MSGPLPVGILGATGAVGQKLVTLLAGHPWFQVRALDGHLLSVSVELGDSAGPEKAEGVLEWGACGPARFWDSDSWPWSTTPSGVRRGERFSTQNSSRKGGFCEESMILL
jgi:aspartate-semialdehyde dehydrogenase